MNTSSTVSRAVALITSVATTLVLFQWIAVMGPATPAAHTMLAQAAVTTAVR